MPELPRSCPSNTGGITWEPRSQGWSAVPTGFVADQQHQSSDPHFTVFARPAEPSRVWGVGILLSIKGAAACPPSSLPWDIVVQAERVAESTVSPKITDKASYKREPWTRSSFMPGLTCTNIFLMMNTGGNPVPLFTQL
ncbi:hypothetical protein llap_12615 [Limosa lapponica baueri]|uniref:Uncharacterized protein n=1 Tax=Limosa lapponica baueri TaxID=1758121 RepID=A0A2I0TTG2_LIMLA|nr:hypothetical protein llap_12615 [Limosa lapponica baueri]